MYENVKMDIHNLIIGTLEMLILLIIMTIINYSGIGQDGILIVNKFLFTCFQKHFLFGNFPT